MFLSKVGQEVEDSHKYLARYLVVQFQFFENICISQVVFTAIHGYQKFCIVSLQIEPKSYIWKIKVQDVTVIEKMILCSL